MKPSNLTAPFERGPPLALELVERILGEVVLSFFFGREVEISLGGAVIARARSLQAHQTQIRGRLPAPDA